MGGFFSYFNIDLFNGLDPVLTSHIKWCTSVIETRAQQCYYHDPPVKLWFPVVVSSCGACQCSFHIQMKLLLCAVLSYILIVLCMRVCVSVCLCVCVSVCVSVSVSVSVSVQTLIARRP